MGESKLLYAETKAGTRFSVQVGESLPPAGGSILVWESGHSSAMGVNFHSIWATADGLIYSESSNGGSLQGRVVSGVAGIILEADIKKRAKDYADHDDYLVTRGYLYALLALDGAKNARIAELERLYAESLDCQECLGKRAEAAYGAAVEAQHAAVGHWEDDK